MADKNDKTPSAKRAVKPANAGSLKTKMLELLELVLRPGAQVAGDIIQNELHFYKTKRLLALDEKLRLELDKRSVAPETTRPLPIGLGTKVLENASKEDDDEVLDLWAKLIASGIDPKGKLIDKVFVGVLSEIGPLEVIILRFMWLRLAEGDTMIRSIQNKKVAEYADKHLKTRDAGERAIAIQNLIRQRCVRLAMNDYYLDQIEVSSTDVLTPAERSRGRSGGDAIAETKHSIDAIRRLLEDLGGLRDPLYLGLEHHGDDNGAPFPELSFEFTELGAELMLRCEPVAS